VNRTEKKEAVGVLHDVFQNNELVVITHYSGLTVSELTELRAKMREAGASFKVTKNRLAQRALQGTKFEQLADVFTGPTAMAVSQDPIAAAKVAYEYAQDNSKLVIVGGAMGDKFLDAQAIETLAKLPSLDEVRAMLLSMLVTPATRLAVLSQAPAAQLARVMNAYATK
jgi:large subunit ribosomal protein L10